MLLHPKVSEISMTCLTEVLDDREQQVIALRYGLYDNQELTQKEISNLLHISRSYVSRIEKKGTA